MPNLRTHKRFSDIEGDIRFYYEHGPADQELTALKIAGRALAVAQDCVEPANRLRVQQAKDIVIDLLEERLVELARETS